ncbi:MAG: hypothetical protein HY231_08000 [Acidobacteria bacterium]|nr:hypothetical protein [Acidobacteriota bacterium]
MNCHEFEKLINDLACDHLMSVAKRAQAWAHQETCAACAARLGEEKLLTERLRMVANADVEQTPAHVKTALLAAFAQHAASVGNASVKTAKPATPALNAPKKLTPSSSLAAQRSRWLWAAAAAAVILIAAIVTWRLWNVSGAIAFPSNTTTMATDSRSVEAPSQNHQAEVTNSPQENPSEHPITTTTPEPKDTATTRPHAVTGKPQSGGRGANSYQPHTTQQTMATSNQNEVVTDYIPLTYLSIATALDSGLVVRVQVPRSTLISMGLPMNVESSKELIKADVVVGDDGVARAIRFVHDLSAKPDGKLMK